MKGSRFSFTEQKSAADTPASCSGCSWPNRLHSVVAASLIVRTKGFAFCMAAQEAPRLTNASAKRRFKKRVFMGAMYHSVALADRGRYPVPVASQRFVAARATAVADLIQHLFAGAGVPFQLRGAAGSRRVGRVSRVAIMSMHRPQRDLFGEKEAGTTLDAAVREMVATGVWRWRGTPPSARALPSVYSLIHKSGVPVVIYDIIARRKRGKRSTRSEG